jgi:hypothetical protein
VSLLSFARLKAKFFFNFIFDSLKKHVFIPSIPLPRVIMSDQAAGIRASLLISLPNTILQFCDWHVVKNIEKRLANKGYPKEIRKEMKTLLWNFIKSHTHTELEANQAAIYAKLRPDKISYLRDY